MADRAPAAALLMPGSIEQAPERDDFSSNRHLALSYAWRMIFSENRYPLFGIMLWCRRFEVPTPPAVSSFRNFKSKSGTRSIYLLVPLCFRSSCQRVLPCITNFGSGALALQQRHGGGVHAPVARDHDTPAALGAAAVPRRDDAAGAGDDRNERNDVVRLELGLDHEIDVAGREHAIGVAVAAIAGEPHHALDARERGAVGFLHQERAGGEQDRVGKIRTDPHQQVAIAGRAAVMGGAAVAGKS